VGRAEDRGDRLGILRRLFQPQQRVSMSRNSSRLSSVGLLSDRHAHGRLLAVQDRVPEDFFRFCGEMTTGVTEVTGQVVTVEHVERSLAVPGQAHRPYRP